MRGRGVGQVIASNHPGYQVGDHALGALNRHGRVVCCGRIAEYLRPVDEPCHLRNWAVIGQQRARMEGVFIYDLAEHFPRAERRMAQWVVDGHNTGKQIVRVDPSAR